MLERANYTLRHYQADDYPALAALLRVANTALGNPTSITPEELRMIVETSGFDARTDSFIVEHDGRIIAMSNQGFRAEEGLCWSDSVVHPDYWGRGIGAELLRLTETRCLKWAAEAVSPQQEVVVRLATAENNTRAMRLFQKHGYEIARVFYRMKIDLSQPIEAPPLPDGLVLRPMDWARDARAVYEADVESFAEHWGEHDSYEEWTRQVLEHPDTDFSLWLVAYEGDEIAGICLNRTASTDQPDTPWVWLLGVRPRWRRRGLGTALLRTSFARFQERGYKGAELMVDSSNTTNAVTLYERAGMRVARRRMVYLKTVRAAE